jgi:pimeloyl-ACP methyl ester carboxylesterase
MARFASYDGTQIGYRVLGAGPPLVCLPGGPGRVSEYLGDLGGLSRSRQLIMVDTRGTGESADASDPASYRCDRLAGDVEALRLRRAIQLRRELPAGWDWDNVSVAAWAGLTAAFCRQHGAGVIIRGVRNRSDFRHEYQLAAMNQTLGITTLLLPAKPGLAAMSSTVMRGLGS